MLLLKDLDIIIYGYDSIRHKDNKIKVLCFNRELITEHYISFLEIFPILS